MPGNGKNESQKNGHSKSNEPYVHAVYMLVYTSVRPSIRPVIYLANMPNFRAGARKPNAQNTLKTQRNSYP